MQKNVISGNVAKVTNGGRAIEKISVVIIIEIKVWSKVDDVMFRNQVWRKTAVGPWPAFLKKTNLHSNATRF